MEMILIAASTIQEYQSADGRGDGALSLVLVQWSEHTGQVMHWSGISISRHSLLCIKGPSSQRYLLS